MQSGIRRLVNQARKSKAPIPLAPYNNRKGSIFDLGVGRMSKEAQLRTYAQSGTVYSIVSLLQMAPASIPWHLFKKQPVDGRVRYTTGDRGSDQRIEVVQHAAVKLWQHPNAFHTNFEFQEGANQHLELAGETFWVLDTETFTFPTSMWYVRPDRMEPVPDPEDYLIGWIYTSPQGEQIPLKLKEVIQEKIPDPMDPFRGFSPTGSIMANIEQQKYATEYQRNLFINGATPGGMLTVPNRLTEPEFDELIARWRETHQGVARAGRVGVLENGISWAPEGMNNKDLEYGNLRLANRDEIREAWRMHKSMLGTADDVNRANAQTAEEVFVSWHTVPRLERRKHTLNEKLLPMFGTLGENVEFDYDNPSPDNREADSLELTTKTNAALVLVQALNQAGLSYEINDVFEVVGLPGIDTEEKPPTPAPAPITTPEPTTPEQEKQQKDLDKVLENMRRNAAWNAARSR